MGRAADRRVDRQAGQGHRAGRRRAAGRARRATATTARSSTCATWRRPTSGSTQAVEALARAGLPGDHARDPRPDGPRAPLLLRRVRDRRRRLGAGHQPVRPAQRAGGQGATRRACSRPTRTTRPTPTTTRCARCSTASAPPHYLGDHRLRAAVAGLRRGGRRASRDGARRDACRDDVRLRPALPALDRTAAQGRAADRPLPAADPRLRARHRGARRLLHLQPPEARAGDRRPRDAARARAVRPSG